jgi:SET domain-containing protein 6
LYKAAGTAHAHDQFNTYASPPNSELLRKYGHVDVYPLPEEVTSILQAEELRDWPQGNPGDEVVIEGDKVVSAISSVSGTSESQLQERVDWWLEEGQDE